MIWDCGMGIITGKLYLLSEFYVMEGRFTTIQMNTERVTVGYTIHNKAYLIPHIVNGLKKCFSPDNEFIFLLDNCTDRSEKELRERETGGYSFLIANTPEEYFEVRANNWILENALSDVIVLFQDDMVCNDIHLKGKINDIFEMYGDRTGLLGGRDGFELNSTLFPERPVDKVSSWVHKPGQGRLLEDNECCVRTFLNRGPLVFTKQLISEVGYLDESYYPQWGDDLDYCADVKFKHGKKNIVFQCDIESRLDWGSTRRKDTSLFRMTRGKHIKRNWELFVSRWGKYINENTI